MEEKRCGRCKQKKLLDEFGLNRTKHDGRDTMCRVCKKAYNAAYHEKTRERFRSLRNEARKRAVTRNQDFIIAYLREHPCVDCGEADIIVLDFDHQGDKVCAVSLMVANGVSLKVLEKEIVKCEVVCANDHRRRTAKVFGWRRALVA